MALILIVIPLLFLVNLRIASCRLNLWTKFYFWRAVISRSFFNFSILKGEENFIPFDRNGELKLFRLLRGMNGPQCNPTPLAPRILFLFTDGYFSDEPKRGAERLCESNILLVIIRIGKFNVKSINELAIPCGIVVSHRLAIPELIQEIRVIHLFAARLAFEQIFTSGTFHHKLVLSDYSWTK